MIEIVTKNGKRIGKISDDMAHEDVLFVDGKAITLADAYNNPDLMKKFNDELKDLNNGVRLEG